MAHIKIELDYGNNVHNGFTVNPMNKITEHFTFKELANNQAKEDVKLILTPRNFKFLIMIEDFRNWFNKPMQVNSFYRTKSFNAKCGGSSNSLHLDGLAMDWGISGHSEIQRNHVIDKWKELCSKYNEVGGINLYTNGYHLSIGEEKFGNNLFTIRDYRGKKGDW